MSETQSGVIEQEIGGELTAEQQATLAAALAQAAGDVRTDATGNRYRRDFPKVLFHVTTNGKEIPNPDGSKSRRIASGVAVAVGGYMGISLNVYARKSGKRTTVDVSFVGNRGTQAITPLDEPSKLELQEYKAWAAGEFLAWRKGQGKAEPARNVSTSVVLDEDLAAGIFEE